MSDKSIEDRLEEIERTLLKVVARFEAYDAKLDAYQKASNQVVNLAFGSIITAVLAIIIPTVIAYGNPPTQSVVESPKGIGR